jgi:hypothetical protein
LTRFVVGFVHVIQIVLVEHFEKEIDDFAHSGLRVKQLLKRAQVIAGKARRNGTSQTQHGIFSPLQLI